MIPRASLGIYSVATRPGVLGYLEPDPEFRKISQCLYDRAIRGSPMWMPIEAKILA